MANFCPSLQLVGPALWGGGASPMWIYCQMGVGSPVHTVVVIFAVWRSGGAVRKVLSDLLDLFEKGERAHGGFVLEVSDFGVAGPFPDALCFPPVGAEQLEVWLLQSWPRGSSLTLSQMWSHGFK